jgi:hypothetical protein
MLFKFEFNRPDTYFEETGSTWLGAGPRTTCYWWAASREEVDSLLQGWAEHEPVFLEEIENVLTSHPNSLHQAIMHAEGSRAETVSPILLSLAREVSGDLPLDWAPRFLNTKRHSTSLRLLRWGYVELIEDWVRKVYSPAWGALPQGEVGPKNEHLLLRCGRALNGVWIDSSVLYAARFKLDYFAHKVPESQETRERIEEIERSLASSKVTLLDEMLKLSRAQS